MADQINHSSGLLLGPEPLHEEEKTAGQLDDERQTSVMAHAKSAYDEEMDETPAIEQHLRHDELIMESAHPTAEKPKLAASAEFEAEIKERNRKEAEDREKRRKAAEAEAARKEAEREKELAKKLDESQELDDEAINENLKEKTYEENQKKLYPDAKPVASDLEEVLWKRRTDKGEQIAGRAKLGYVQNDKLRGAIANAMLLNVGGAVLTVVGLLVANFQRQFGRIILVVSIVSFVIAIVLLTYQAHRAKHHEIPSDLARSFAWATIIPGVIFRIPFITAASIIPTVGQLIGPVIGCAIAASIHYTYLNNYGIRVSASNTLLSAAVFIALYLFVIMFSFSNTGADASVAFSLINIAITIVGYFIGDFMAMRLAYLTSK